MAKLTAAELGEGAFRDLLDRQGLRLEGRAFAAALDGARHLRREVERLRLIVGTGRDEEA